MLLALAPALVALSCSHDSFLVVTVTSADTPFTGVSWIDVDVSGGGASSPATLSYGAREPLSFTSTTGVTFSVSFTPSRSGNVTLAVTAYGADHRTCLGRATKDAAIKKGDVAAVAVQLRHGDCAPVVDGGPPPDASPPDGNVTFPGCDPTDPEGTCQSGKTCFVDCVSRAGLCVAGGKKGPGETCQSNNDCMPGTQCFDYSSVTGCAAGTRICLKFCASDEMCQGSPGGTGGTAGNGGRGDAGAATGAGGTSGVPATGPGGGGGASGAGDAAGMGGATADGAGGAGGRATLPSPGLLAADTPPELTPSACRNPVACSATLQTSYRTCSLACDPRGGATAGCPAGLFCFLYRDPVTGRDNPDCGCSEPTRIKTEGMACSGGNDCVPGLVCNVMAGSQICRPLCKPSVPGDCAAGKTCQPLTGATFGVCI